MSITSETRTLDRNYTTAPTMFDPALTYYADGTPVVMRWAGGEKRGVACGMSTDKGPYQFQAVTWDDGGADLVAPHVLHVIEPAPTEDTVPEIREDNCRNCSHGVSDITGYVVAYSRISGDRVLFEDIAYIPDANGYAKALDLVQGARSKVDSGAVEAAYAVIHTVYGDGHRSA